MHRVVNVEPPRRRGKEDKKTRLLSNFRITPAWAGKNWPTASTTSTGWDHPRMGGEKTWFLTNSFPKEGSPPHGRGKVFGLKGGNVVVRITPAWAGKRPWMPSDSSSSRDHPRVGGEKNVLGIHLPSKVGSPRVGGEKPVCLS